MTTRNRKLARWVAPLVALTLLAAACGDDDDITVDPVDEVTEAAEEAVDEATEGAEEVEEAVDEATDPEEPAEEPEEPEATAGGDLEQTEFFVREDYERQLAQMEMEPEGPADQIWLQAIDPTYIDTSEFAVDGDWHVCFSNVGEGNPWRTQGTITAQAAVDADERIGEFTYLNAEFDDNKQISDIQSLLTQDCDALIIAPFDADAAAPAAEEACEAGLPVIVLASPLNTDCTTTYVSSIGGYAYGFAGADYICEQLGEGDKVLALRIVAGVAELEWRWGAAVEAFNSCGVDVVSVEFTGGDPATAKQVVTDAIQREGDIDAVWMDAGADAIPTIEAFEDAGVDIPIIVGEDENRFLAKWAEEGFDAVAPTFSNAQWRTAIVAATEILAGNEVPERWIIPQPVLDTPEERDEAYEPDLGPLFYSVCGCRDLANFPSAYE